MQAEVKHPVYFFRHLFRAAEDMGIILGESTDLQHAVENAAALVTVYRRPLRPA